MPTTTPTKVVSAFVEAMNRGDIETAVSHYEPSGILVAQPGVVAVGAAAIREALTGMLQMNPRLTTASQEVFSSNEVALYHSNWSMSGTGPDGNSVTLSGQSSDVLRRQPGGEWKIAIDNPWGTAVLPNNA